MSQEQVQNENVGEDNEKLCECERVADSSEQGNEATKDEQLSENEGRVFPMVVDDCLINQLVADIFSNKVDQQFQSVQKVRKILSKENPRIDVMIQAGIVPRCIEFLKDEQNSELLHEASWILTNIASGTSDQTDVVVKAGAIEPLIKLLKSPFTHVAQQATWALGNITRDGPVLRDLVVSKGIVEALITLAESNDSTNLLHRIAWVFISLCKTTESPPPPEVRKCLPLMTKLIQKSDINVVSETCRVLYYLSEGSNENIEEVVQSGVLDRLIYLLDSPNDYVVSSCLRTVGNIATGNDNHTQAIIDCGCLPQLAKLLKSSEVKIAKEAAWIVSNVATGNRKQINSLINAGLVPLLINVLRYGEHPVQKQAAKAITNIIFGGSIEHKILLCNNGAIPAMCDMLGCWDRQVILVVLDGINCMLETADGLDQKERMASAIEDCGGLDKIESLQAFSKENDCSVCKKAYHIIRSFSLL